MSVKATPSIFLNIHAQLAGQAGITITQLCYMVVVARYLDVQSFGVFSLAAGIVQMVLVVSDMGLNLFIAREIASSPSSSRETLRRALPLKVLLAFCFAALVALGGRLWLNSEVSKVLALFGAGMGVHSVAISFNVAFQGHGELRTPSATAFLLTFLQFAIGAVCLLVGGGVLALGFAYLAAAAISLIVSYTLFTRRVHGIDFAPDLLSVPDLVRQSLPMGLGGALNTIGNRIDVALLFALGGAVQVALYAAAYRITGTLYNIPIAIFTAVLPFMSRARWNTREMDDILENALLISIISGSSLFLFFTVAGPQVLVWLFGSSYTASGPMLRILSWALIPAFINVGLLNASISQKETAFAYAVSAGMGACVNVGLNLWWIPLWGSAGAAYATVATEVAMLGTYFYLLRRNLQPGPIVRAGKVLVVSLCAGVVVCTTRVGGLTNAVFVLVIYSALVFWFGKFSIRDWKFWTQRLAHN